MSALQDEGEHNDVNPRHADDDSALSSLTKARHALKLDNIMTRVEKDRVRINLGKQIQKMIRRKREIDNCVKLDAILTNFCGLKSLSELTGQRRQRITQIQDAN